MIANITVNYTGFIALNQNAKTLAVTSRNLTTVFNKSAAGAYKVAEVFPIEVDPKGIKGSNHLTILSIYYNFVVHLYELLQG